MYTSDITMKKYFLILSFFFIVFPGYAQSRYLENGISGSGVEIFTTFEDSVNTSWGLDASYSIGGIMDIGFSAGREEASFRSVDVVEWNYAFQFNSILIKQTEYIPLSFQLELEYGFTNLALNDSRDTVQLGLGQGFEVGGSIFRTFFPKNILSFTLGAKAAYKNYLFSGLDPLVFEDPAQQRFIDFRWGGLAAVSFQFKRGFLLVLETELFYNYSSDNILIEPSLFFIAPSY